MAKLTPPVLPRVIERARLFRQLNRATKVPLTWIAAPPGAGKTTLLASYVKKRRRSVVWYRLDAGDADSSTFFHYLVLAVQAAAPRVRHPLPHLTPEYFAGLPIFTQRFFEALGEKVHRPTMLVFDNYHEVPMEALLHQLLPVGIQRLPPHIRVVVLSREAFPQGYIRMEAERQLRTIRPEELELTKAEARLLYDLQTKRSPLSTKTQKIGHFWELVRGWMAGFILLLEHGSDKEVNAGNSPQAIFDYLAAEVMNQCPPITRDILITMSLVPDFTPEMAVALTGRPEAGRILEQLHRNRYFIERRKDRVGWFRYHPLFRDFLQRRAQQALDAEALGRLRESAASFLISVNLEADAADLLEAAGAWDSYRALIKQYGPLLMQQGRVHTLEAWIRRLPESERAVDPWMDLWLAHCHLSLAPREATVLYESAFNKFRKRGEQEPMLLAWAGVVHSIIFSYSGMKRIHDWLQIFDEIHLPGSTFPSSEVEQLVTDALAVGYTYVAPDQPQARRWLNRTVALWDRGATPVGPFSKYFTEHCFIGFDDFTTLYAIFTKSKKNFERGGASPVERILHYLLTGALGWLQADVEECREAMKEGLALCESSGLLVFRVLLTSHGIYNELLIGNVGAARTLLEQIKPVSLSMGGLHLTHFLMLASWADLIDRRIFCAGAMGL